MTKELEAGKGDEFRMHCPECRTTWTTLRAPSECPECGALVTFRTVRKPKPGHPARTGKGESK